MFVVIVKSGEEVIETISKAMEDRGVKDAAIASLVGAIDYCALSNMPANDAHSDIITEYKQPLEMSGTGEVRDGKPHVHCVVSGEGNSAIGGHLHRAFVGPWFVHAYVAPLSDNPSH
jgi:predicted DNA-binding protein with PD1-like motif